MSWKSRTICPKVELEGAPPCFHYRTCGHVAALEKCGKSLCSPCAARYGGAEYPLRAPGNLRMYRLTFEQNMQILDWGRAKINHRDT